MSIKLCPDGGSCLNEEYIEELESRVGKLVERRRGMPASGSLHKLSNGLGVENDGGSVVLYDTRGYTAGMITSLTWHELVELVAWYGPCAASPEVAALVRSATLVRDELTELFRKREIPGEILSDSFAALIEALDALGVSDED